MLYVASLHPRRMNSNIRRAYTRRMLLKQWATRRVRRYHSAAATLSSPMWAHNNFGNIRRGNYPRISAVAASRALIHAVRNANLCFINKLVDKVGRVCLLQPPVIPGYSLSRVHRGSSGAREILPVWRTRRKLLPLIVPYLARLPPRACNKSALRRRTPL